MLQIKEFIFHFKASLVIFLLKLKGYSFRVVETSDELNAVSRLKYRVYLSAGYIAAEQHPKGQLNDQYDPFATNIGAFFRGELVGTVRLVRDSVHGFPTEKLFNIVKVSEREKTLEIGRLVIDKEFRSQATAHYRFVMFGLAYLLLDYSIRHGIAFWIANMPEHLANSYEQFGAHFVRLAEQPLTEQNQMARSIIAGYFAKKTLFPYSLEVATIFLNRFSLRKVHRT